VVVVSYSGKEINAKLVYYGAGLSGKTTNLEAIYEAVPETSRGKMVSMKTQSDRTLFFDLLPLDLGEIMGFKTRFLLYTVPGQVFYNATRKLVLKGSDAIVFVADSEVGKMEGNKESLANLRANLAEYNLSLDEIPWVLQFNKRDVPNVYSTAELNAELNPGGKVLSFEAIATKGKGVFETFRGVSHLLMEKVTRDLRRTPFGSASRSAPAPSEASGDAGADPHRSAAARAAMPEPSPLAVDYGREISLPGEDGGVAVPAPVQLEPPFSPPEPSARGAAPPQRPRRGASPAPAMPPAPAPAGARPAPSAPLPAIEVEAVATPSPDGLVVPVTLKPGARQVILKIVIKLDDAA